MSLYGTNNEERTDLTKTESRFIRQRSRKLLGSLLATTPRKGFGSRWQ